ESIEEEDGFVRISQAIQAYNWPNSSLKECPSYHPSTKFKDLLDNDTIESIGENSSQLKESDNETDDFDHLFDKFSEIKLKSSQMNETDRKQYAEDMTIAFWKAIGGDEEEIKGLDSSFN
ncbi:unnamed protein product, partial [Medioppia subpectinata]